MKRLIVGRNPIGIEIACWDIAGKFYNAPVCNLLGGRMREQVPMYANAWFTGARTPEQFAEKARYTVCKGMKALKWDPFGKAHMTLSRREMDASVACVARCARQSARRWSCSSSATAASTTTPPWR